MRVSQKGDLYVATHITGPTHNYLGLRVKRSSGIRDYEINTLPSMNDRQHQDIPPPNEIRRWIDAGVERANDEIGSDFSVHYAEIIEGDSRRPEVYQELARRIVLTANTSE